MSILHHGIHSSSAFSPRSGILEQLMTSLFGVNDEVYQDIADLDKNQQQLIQSSNHQTKFMLQALSQFNETSVRVTENLKHFKKKLDDGLLAINNMQSWYKSVDENKLGIHLLSAYQMANNYIEEMLQHYQKILEVHYNIGSFYEFITPAHVQEILETASKSLPSNLKILSHPMIQSDVDHSAEFIHVYGYFIIAEINSYIVIKTTPVPFKVENGFYWTLETTKTIIAIDYNNQHYFQLTEDEFEDCTKIDNNEYICSPPVIRDIDTSPDCIIDEIYNRTENFSCKVIQKQIKTLVWKQLYTRNTWLFITPEVTRVAVTCNGNREEVKLSKTGIITISQNCIITTNKVILTPKRREKFPVVAGFARSVVANLTTSTKQFSAPSLTDDDTLVVPNEVNTLMDQETMIQDELRLTHWTHIHHRSIWTSTVTTITIIISVTGLVFGIKWFRRWFINRSRRHGVEKKNTEDPIEEIELSPLYSSVNHST